MDVYWLEQSEKDVPEHHDWLSAGEAARVRGMRYIKRRTDWRLGRWTAKRAVALFLKVPDRALTLANIEILPAPSGAPEVFFAGEPAPMTVSLSHRAGLALCAVAGVRAELGCDLEVIEPHSAAFLSDYFAIEEQALVANAPPADRPRLMALLWSAKESALKALHAGLRRDTRSVIVSPHPSTPRINGWHSLRVRSDEGRVFSGWWRQANGLVRTLVADPPPGPPILWTRTPVEDHEGHGAEY